MATGVLCIDACMPKPPEALTAQSDWCPEGFEQGAGDTCFSMPAQKSAQTGILLYAHAVASADDNRKEFEAVAAAAKGRFAVVLARGRKAACDFSSEQRDSYCWPKEGEANADARDIAAGWDKALWQVDQLLEGEPHQRVVLGYREGAAFALRVADEAQLPATAFVTIALPPSTGSHSLGNAFDNLVTTDATPNEALKKASEQAHHNFVYCARKDGALAADDLINVLDVALAQSAKSPRCTFERFAPLPKDPAKDGAAHPGAKKPAKKN